MDTTNTRNTNREAILWVAGGCLVVLICIGGVFVSGFAGLYWLGSQTAEEVTVQVNVPASAQVGKPFEFSIAVTNISAETVELTSIDFSMNFLRGIIVDRSIPSYTETDQYDGLGGETYLTYYFNQSIAPGETLLILFSGTAVSPGSFSGDVDVCINSDFNCATNIARTFIE